MELGNMVCPTIRNPSRLKPLLPPERCVLLNLDLSQRNISAHEQDGTETRRSMVLPYAVPVAGPVDIRDLVDQAAVVGALD
jgi:hypothetical protein